MGDSITVGDDAMTATVIPKSAFKEMKNDTIDYEPYVCVCVCVCVCVGLYMWVKTWLF